MIILYTSELIAIRQPLLILHFKNFLNMKIQSLAKLHVKPKHRRVSRRKSNGSWSFFGPAFQIEKKEGERRRKRMKERPKEAAAGEHTQPYGKLFSLFWKTVLLKGTLWSGFFPGPTALLKTLSLSNFGVYVHGLQIF